MFAAVFVGDNPPHFIYDFQARNLSKHVSRDVLPVFLPAVAVDRYLDRLRRAQFRLSDKSLQQRDNFLPIAYYWHKFRGKY